MNTTHKKGVRLVLALAMLAAPLGVLGTPSTAEAGVLGAAWNAIAFVPNELWKVGMGLLGAAIIEISRIFLILAGLLFNWLIDHTIIQFGGTVYASIKTAVETAWTAFRDIANIIIIGIFTFVAIGTILGLQNYNAKKMVAKVLIIAVLINFSLLFTKMIIDASNYTAAQIYTAAALGGSSAVTAGTPGTSFGVADQFLNLLGVGTAGNALKVVDDVAQAKDSGWAALVHGVLISAVILGAAMVLFYGCFLLVSRMIMLIFLMSTASIAFASYLVPKWSEGHFGWSAWWSSLIWCATLGPTMMILLWLTLNVSYALALKDKTRPILGAALSDPKGDNIEAIFTYAIVLGLLFGTFKLSSMWASKIGGFNYAKLVPGTGVGIAAAITGLAGRNTVGWGARVARQSMRANQWAEQGGVKRTAVRIANTLARTTYNPLKPKLASTAAAAIGVPGLLRGKDAYGAPSFEDKMKGKAKAADDVRRQVATTQTADQAAREGRTRYREQRNQMDNLIRQQADTREQLVRTFSQRQNDRPEAEQDLRTAQEALERERRMQTDRAHDYESDLRAAEAEVANGRRASDDLAAMRANRRTEMDQEAQRIRDAQSEIAHHQQTLTQMDQAAQAQADASDEVRNLTAAVQTATQNLGGLGTSEQDADRRARDAHRQDNVRLGQALLWDPRARPDIEGAMREHQASENWRHVRDAFQPEREAERPQAAPETPPQGGAAH